MSDKFKLADGQLSAYAFACGHIQRKEVGELRLDLWHEGACFHVRAHEFNGRGRLFWECFESIAQARKFWKKQKRALFTSSNS